MRVRRYKDRLIPIFTAEDAPLCDAADRVGWCKRSTKDKKKYIKDICAFDIETTAYTLPDGSEGRAMFHWQFSYNNSFCVLGRTMDELRLFFERLSNEFAGLIVTICVHNLTYEAQFIGQMLRAQFGDGKFLMFSSRKIQSMTYENLRFIDTLVMSGSSLQVMSADYNLYYEKAAGDLDYKKRFSVTDPLTPEEELYCILDVFALVEWYQTIQKQRGYTVAQMPITKTGFVRNPLRSKLMHKGHAYTGKNYRDWIPTIQNTYEVYEMLVKQFAGGIVALAPGYHGHVIRGDIRCRDFTSSYPYVMTHENFYYPVTKFQPFGKIDFKKDFDILTHMLNENCCLFTATFIGLCIRSGTPAAFLSSSRCDYIENPIKHNGKIARADVCRKVVNEIEFWDILKYYAVEEIYIEDFYTARRGQLPEMIREKVKELFEAKTQLKGIPGKDLEYLLSKGDLNSLFGMSAMRVLREEFAYNYEEMAGDLKEIDAKDMKKLYEKAVKSRNNFLSYAWGNYVTSWARHNLLRAMDLVGKENWIYSDTDSVYYFSTPEIEGKFELFNSELTAGALQAKNEKTGKISVLGEMTPDGEYSAFLGYGAKKYFLQKKDGSLKMTVAGVPKRNKATGKNINDWIKSIDDIRIGHIFTGEETGKLRPEYVVQDLDYRNVNGVITLCGSYINLLPCDYQLNDSIYEDWLYNDAADSYRDGY